MVSKNLSSYTGTPPQGSPEDRVKIPGGPLYSAEQVMHLLGKPDCIRVSTQKCRNDLRNLSFEEDLRPFLGATVQQQRFKGSEWCKLNDKDQWAACDSYTYVRSEWIENAGKYMNVEYFVKFGIGRNGIVLLLVSCHV